MTYSYNLDLFKELKLFILKTNYFIDTNKINFKKLSTHFKYI